MYIPRHYRYLRIRWYTLFNTQSPTTHNDRTNNNRPDSGVCRYMMQDHNIMGPLRAEYLFLIDQKPVKAVDIYFVRYFIKISGKLPVAL